MTHLFNANIQLCRIAIRGCPESGLPALDYRRAHGLTERLDNRQSVSLVGAISEVDFRRLVAAGWRCSCRTDGGQAVEYDDLPQSYSPCDSWGHVAEIRVEPTDTIVDLLVRARRHCEWEHRGGAARLKAAREAAESAQVALEDAQAELEDSDYPTDG